MTYTKAVHTELSATHQSNLLTLLNHRLEVAKEHHNQQLVAALEQEYEQLTQTTRSASVGAWFYQRWTQLATTLSDWSKVHIEQVVGEDGKNYWYAYNPQAGQAICTESEADMQSWIKKSYWGR